MTMLSTAQGIDAFLLAHNVIITSLFVPMTGTPKPKARCYNYTVTVNLNGRAVITSPYSMGVAHGEFYKRYHAKDGRTLDYDRAELELVTAGKTNYRAHGWKWFKAPEPAPRDVFMSLVMDAQCSDMPFDAFCAEFGYSTIQHGEAFIRHDARAIYDTCTNIRYKLRQGLGDEALDKAMSLASEW